MDEENKKEQEPKNYCPSRVYLRDTTHIDSNGRMQEDTSEDDAQKKIDPNKPPHRRGL